MKITNEEFYKKFNKKESLKITGKAILTFCNVSSKEAKRMEKRVIHASENGSWRTYQILKNEFHKKFGVRTLVIDNLVSRGGRTILARILKGDITYSGEINYCALGTGEAASTTSDTKLATEQHRKQISSGAYSNYKTYISTFFTAGEFQGTIKEIGHFIDGAAGADTGQLWSRIADPETAELPITKTAIQSLTIDYEITL